MTNPKRTFLLLSLVALMLLTIMPLGVVKAQEKLFKITLIAPGNANMVRRQWGQIFANSLQQLGIDARVVYLNWAPVYDRVLTPLPENVGKIYDEGGYDVQLIGWTPGLIPEPRQVYYGGPGFFAPDGQNYYLWNNTAANALLDTFITTTDIDVQSQTAQAWQSIYFNEIPASQIFYAATPSIVTPELGGPGLAETANGPGWLYFNAQPMPEFLTGKTSVVYASTGEIESLVPPLSNSWYDTIINAVIFNGLAQVAPDLSDLAIPALLTDWTPSNNGFKWTFECRTGVKWHDGEDFTADDVVYSLWALMNPDTGSQFVGYYKGVYGDNVKFTFSDDTSTTLGTGTKVGNITAIDADTVEVWLPELIPGKPYGYFDPYLLTLANNIIPMHIFEKLPPAQWTDSPFNTGVGTIVIPGTPGTVAPETYNGPVGTGPYKWVSFEPAAQLVTLQKFSDYWNRTNLEADGYYDVTNYYIKYIIDKTPAIAALKNEQVDMLDPNYQMQVDLPTIDPAWGRVLLQDGTGRQEIGYNMQHPLIGTGVDTPLGQSNPARAAEAARYVRTAFDYAVPRQLIIDNLLAGFGDPGATPMLPTQPYFNASITPRPYDLALAREYLEKAGYTVPGPAPPPPLPSFILGMSNVISGYFKPDNPNRELSLWETTDNTTYTTSSTMIGLTTTDINGWYSFTVTPMTTGMHYYYLFDRQAIIFTERHTENVNANDAYDPGEYIYTDEDSSGFVSVGDFRLTDVSPYTNSSYVETGDADIGNALITFTALEKHTDPNESGGYNPGEYIYRDTDNSDDVSVGDVRLTAVSPYSAGSTVATGNADIGNALVVFPAESPWTYVRSIDVSSLADAFAPTDEKIEGLSNKTDTLTDQIGGLQNQLTILTGVAVVAIIVAVVFGIVNFYMLRKKP